MTTASIYTIVMGTLIGIITWIFLAFKVPGLPFGRTLGTFGGAVLMLVFGVISPTDAFAAINLETIALLFGTMVISVLLEREGFFSVFILALTYRCTSAFSLLARVCLASALLSALMTNDTVCVFFTPVIVDLCELHELPHGPFLIALATSANIGSTATAVGNPQNMIIAALSGISYGQFILYIGPATLVCLALNIALLCLCYRELAGREVRVCHARFVRATEEEMEQLMGKSWEKEMTDEKEREESRRRRREKQTALLQQQQQSQSQSASADKESEETEEKEEDASSIKRRKGGVEPVSRVSAEDEAQKAATAASGDHRIDVAYDDEHYAACSQEDDDTLPVEAARHAERQAVRGRLDEEVKADEEAKREQSSLQTDRKQEEQRELEMQQLPSRAPRQRAAPYQQSSSTQDAPLTPQHAKLLHADSVAIILYELQLEQRQQLQEEEKAKGNWQPPAPDADGAADEDNSELMKRRRVRTRIADWKHPRKTGRLLRQLPPDISSAQLLRLQRRRQRRTVRQALHDSQPAASPPATPSAQFSLSATSSADSLLPEQEAAPASPFDCLRRVLPARVFSALLLVPLPSKLLLFFLILVGTIVAFATGLNLGWAALGGACVMLLLDWRDPDGVIGLVDWSLLVFFSSLFVVTQAFQETELPSDAWSGLQGSIDVDTVAGLVLYSVIVLVGSNTVSNVPLVLLLGPSIPQLGNPFTSWLLLSFVSTVAGNLTLVGSVANLIVASRAKSRYALGFVEYLRFGFPSTILITAVGVLMVKATSLA